jgi:predicted nicotinamide N-methyase
MKKYFLLVTVLLLALSSFAGIVINTTLTLGRKSQNCTGFGICSATATTDYVAGLVNVTLDFDKERGSMIIGINKIDLQNVQPDKIVFFDNKSEVVFSEDFVFDNEIKLAVQASKPLVITKGEYILIFRNGKYYIEIPL